MALYIVYHVYHADEQGHALIDLQYMLVVEKLTLLGILVCKMTSSIMRGEPGCILLRQGVCVVTNVNPCLHCIV